MSHRERVLQLVNDIPENRLVFVINLLESLKAYAGEELEPDEWDLQMIKEAAHENDGSAITMEELAKELNIGL